MAGSPLRLLPPSASPSDGTGTGRRNAWVNGYVAALLIAAVAVAGLAAYRAARPWTTSAAPAAAPPAPATPSPLAPVAPAASPRPSAKAPPSPASAVNAPALQPAPTRPVVAAATAKARRPAAKKKPARVQAVAASGKVTTTAVVESPTAYRLRNSATDKCITVSGTAMAQYGCADRTDQLFTLQQTRKVDGVPRYRLRSDSAGTCVDVPGDDGMPIGTRLAAATCPALADSAASNDEWTLRDTGSEHRDLPTYALVNTKSDLCFDVGNWNFDGTDRADGQDFTLYTCEITEGDWDDHLWVFSR